MLQYVALALGAAVVGVLGAASRRPDTFRVERRRRIAAPPEDIFPLLVDFRRWPAWSPWETLDPGMTRTHTGAAEGVGAVYEWTGNRKVGAGRMEITHADPPHALQVQLDFLRPFEAHNVTQFTLARAAGDPAATDVTWAMSGASPFVSKVMGVVMNMDALIGRDFARGLDQLDRAATAPR